MAQMGAEAWGDGGQRTSSSLWGHGAPQEGPGKPPVGVRMFWLRISAQTGKALGEAIWADLRVQAEMVGFGGLAIFWVRQWGPSGPSEPVQTHGWLGWS